MKLKDYINENISGEYLGDINELRIWTAKGVAVASIKVDDKTGEVGRLVFNAHAPQVEIDHFKNSKPMEHIADMVRQIKSGRFKGNDGKLDLVYAGGKLIAKRED